MAETRELKEDQIDFAIRVNQVGTSQRSCKPSLRLEMGDKIWVFYCPFLTCWWVLWSGVGSKVELNIEIILCWRSSKVTETSRLAPELLEAEKENLQRGQGEWQLQVKIYNNILTSVLFQSLRNRSLILHPCPCWWPHRHPTMTCWDLSRLSSWT